ncbi:MULTISPECIES: MlaD family protein [Burkholderia]|uniref:MlaD family protein n=1 Tax=Burkholderia TaxID=32008 RepID=UPI000327FC15|nr:MULTISPECIES: MlaD family protein [Burkholderia]AGK48012.1 mce related family protein [Burkholderia thailandensis MSMB121]ATF35003.1 MCE family protein [Burkholderia thailandensis]KST75579.1 ABC transporter substrate-binding protein [Burkholderia humptydooensis]KVN08835.1 ABC transporter substrate-binding protein [Burkholderia sp. MSMB1552]KWZ54687.1 ABC transporter substrate-binding protein [Burkholderia sp. MSMB1588]
MENKSHAFWAGLFTIALLAAIVGAVYWFNVDRTVRAPYDLVSRSNVTGLFPDAAVRYRGLDVGKVQSINFDRGHPGQIVIRILVDTNAPITRSTFGSLGFQGVTGIAFVQLDDTGADLAPLPTSAKAVAQIPMRPSLFDQLQQRGDVLLKQMEIAAKSVNEMLSPEMRGQLKATAASMQQAADGITQLSKQVEPALAQMPQTMAHVNRALGSANALVAPGGPLVANLNRAGQALASMNDTLAELSARVRYDTLPRFNALATNVGDTSRTLKDVAGDVGRNPRSLLFGAPAAEPGPGESGFVWPGATPAQ